MLTKSAENVLVMKYVLGFSYCFFPGERIYLSFIVYSIDHNVNQFTKSILFFIREYLLPVPPSLLFTLLLGWGAGEWWAYLWMLNIWELGLGPLLYKWFIQVSLVSMVSIWILVFVTYYVNIKVSEQLSIIAIFCALHL